MSSGTNVDRKYSHVLVACARWETNYIVEWILYHRTIGFDHIFLYCNDDDPTELRDAVLPFILGSDPFVTFHHVSRIGEQQFMYLHFLYNHKNKSEWMCFLDIDEFIRLPRHGSVADFVDSFEGRPDSIYLNWCFFGNNGFDDRPPGHVLTNYTKRCSYSHNYMTKHLTRTASIDPRKIRLGPMSDFWHYWNSLSNFEELKIVNVLGHDMHRYYDSPDKSKSYFTDPNFFEQLLQVGVINHYAYKSRKDFLIRAARGTHGVFAQQAAHKKTYEDGRADAVLVELNQVDDFYLSSFWKNHIRKINRVTSLRGTNDGNLESGSNISRGKPAMQSSVSEWSSDPSPEKDAEGAVNGVVDGMRKFHTSFEANPWWQVDLCGQAEIQAVHIYNTIEDTANRFKRFKLTVSNDGVSWIELMSKLDEETVGGVNSSPFVWAGPGRAFARFVRVTLLGNDFLHLDQVEVFGEIMVK